MNPKVAIIGGGASGVYCAIRLSEISDCEIHLFEKSNELLKKVKISGGGRCNVTHNFISNAQFSKNYPRGSSILKKNFEQFSASDMKSWLESQGVKLKTEADGRMFPITDNSQTIIDCFERNLKKHKVNIRFESEISDLNIRNEKFELKINGEIQKFDIVVVATGGAQKERDLDMYKSLLIKRISPVPSLFTFKINEKSLTDLMGLSVPNATVKILQSNFKETGIVLVTHWGLSGPAILKLSAWGAFFMNDKNYNFQISVNWTGDKNEDFISKEIENLAIKHSQAKVCNQKLDYFPNRFWEYLLVKSEIDLNRKWADISKKNKNKLAQFITNSIYDIGGKTTYKEEFVTAGGINTDELNPNTMESKSIPNLYFIGEVTNIDGITGGFNFQNAWTSAVVCANSISRI